MRLQLLWGSLSSFLLSLQACDTGRLDLTPVCRYDLDRRPEVSNLLSIYAALSNRPLEDVCADADLTQRGTAHFKARLTEVHTPQLLVLPERFWLMRGICVSVVLCA